MMEAGARPATGGCSSTFPRRSWSADLATRALQALGRTEALAELRRENAPRKGGQAEISRRLDAICRPAAFFATNTSAIPHQQDEKSGHD